MVSHEAVYDTFLGLSGIFIEALDIKNMSLIIDIFFMIETAG